MEIIARRKGGMLFWFVLMLISGIFCTVMGFNASTDKFGEIKFLASGIVLLLLGGVVCLLYLRTPRIVITYDDGKLSIGGREYKPSQITSVNYRRVRMKSGLCRWGAITIKIGEKTYRYTFVADVEGVHNRLIALIKEDVWEEGANAVKE